jgi:hypothetical protein
MSCPIRWSSPAPGTAWQIRRPCSMPMLLVAFEVVSQRPYNPDHALPVDDECAAAQVGAVRRWRFGLPEKALDLGRCRVRDFRVPGNGSHHPAA